MIILKLINHHFRWLIYKEFPAINLNIFRVLFCLGFLLSLLYHRSFYFDDINACIFNPLDFVSWIKIDTPSPYLFQLLFVSSIVFLASSFLGIFTRTSLFLAGLTTLFFFAFFLSCGKPDHPTYLNTQHKIAIGTLFILAISPKIDLLKFKNIKEMNLINVTVPLWPVSTIVTNLGFTYFSAGLCKLYFADWDWFGHGALTHVLLSRHLLLDLPFTAHLLSYPYLIQFFSISTMILELGFIICLFYPRSLYVFVPFSLVFQFMIAWLMDIEFFYFFGLNYLIFINYKKWIHYFYSKKAYMNILKWDRRSENRK